MLLSELIRERVRHNSHGSLSVIWLNIIDGLKIKHFALRVIPQKQLFLFKIKSATKNINKYALVMDVHADSALNRIHLIII